MKLRERKAQPVYLSGAAFSGADDTIDLEGVVGSSARVRREPELPAEGSSDSDYEPDDKNDVSSQGDEVEEAGAEIEDEELSDSSLRQIEGTPPKSHKVSPAKPSRARAAPKPKTSKGQPNKSSNPGVLSISGPSRATQKAAAIPAGANVRHKPLPLYVLPEVSRLLERPSPFSHGNTTPTNPSSGKICERVNKSWAHSVGAGPEWRLLEDRAWWKEGVGEGIDAYGEQCGRPRVYEEVSWVDSMDALSEKEALDYVPSGRIGDDDVPDLPATFSCSVGPMESQAKIDIRIFEHRRLNDFMPTSSSHVLNAGGPIWGVDWCPMTSAFLEDISFKQYLAVAPFPSSDHFPAIGGRLPTPYYACIQIWSFAPPRDIMEGVESLEAPEEFSLAAARVQCETVICLDCGPAHLIKWCPLPSHDEEAIDSAHKKLGILAGAFGDGSVAFYAIPHLSDTSKRSYVRLRPLLRLELPETVCCTLDWANSEVVGVGCTNGCVAVFNVKDALAKGVTERMPPLLPTHYVTAHQCPIRSVSWVRAPPVNGSGAFLPNKNPTVIASVGYDGAIAYTDIREPGGQSVIRSRDVALDVEFSSFGGSVFAVDNDNSLKCLGVSPSVLGKSHATLEAQGPIWSISTSDYHPHVAVAVSDGSVMITNFLKAGRKGAIVPILAHKLYQMDYKRPTGDQPGEYRMLDHFLPQDAQSRRTVARTQSMKKKAGDTQPEGTADKDENVIGIWPIEVGVHRVAWNSGGGMSRAPLLASGMACGLVRIDWLVGRFWRDRIPRVSIELMRGETAGNDSDGKMDQDSDAA